jgi:hypothetical protein
MEEDGFYELTIAAPFDLNLVTPDLFAPNMYLYWLGYFISQHCTALSTNRVQDFLASTDVLHIPSPFPLSFLILRAQQPLLPASLSSLSLRQNAKVPVRRDDHLGKETWHFWKALKAQTARLWHFVQISISGRSVD